MSTTQSPSTHEVEFEIELPGNFADLREVVLLLGCGGAGKGTMLNLVEKHFPKELLARLEMSKILEPHLTTELRQMKARGELFPMPFVTTHFKGALMSATNLQKPAVVGDGCCRRRAEVAEYFDMLTKRRRDYNIHVVDLRCGREAAIERMLARGQKARKGDGALRLEDLDLEVLGKRWDEHHKELPEVLDAIGRYGDRVTIHQVDVTSRSFDGFRKIAEIYGARVTETAN